MYNDNVVDSSYARQQKEYEATDAEYDSRTMWWVWVRNSKGRFVNFGFKRHKDGAEALGREKALKVGTFAGEFRVLPLQTSQVSEAQRCLKRWLSDNEGYDIDDATNTMIRKPAEEAKKKEDSPEFWRFLEKEN